LEILSIIANASKWFNLEILNGVVLIYIVDYYLI